MGKPPTAHDLVGDLKPDQIIIEPQNEWWSAKMDLPESTYTESVGPGKDVDLPPCWTAPSLENRKYWEPWPMIMLDRPVSIESFVGGKVKAIRVQEYDPGLTPPQVRDEVRRVWLGLFTEAYSSIIWSEMNRWNIKASVEFEDGGHTWILTGRDSPSGAGPRRQVLVHSAVILIGNDSWRYCKTCWLHPEHRPGSANRTSGPAQPSALILVNRLDRRYHERR
jgi:hypothetical protein